jgi:MFS family permease
LLSQVFEPDYLPDPAMRHNARMSLIDGMYYSGMVGMTLPFLALCTIALGGNDYLVGLVTTLPAIVALVSQLPGAALVEGEPSLLRSTLRYAMMHRVFYAVLAIIPLLALPDAGRAWLLVIVLAIMNVPSTICGVAWTAMMGQIYPTSLLGRVFGDRSMMCQLTTVTATMVAGWLIDALPFPYNWTVLFALCFGFVMASWYYLTLMRVPARQLPAGRRLPSLADLGAQRRFINYTAGAFVFHLGFNLTVPVFALLFVRHLGLGGSWIGALATVSGLFVAFTSRYWGRLADRIGTVNALLRALLGLTPLPLLFIGISSPWLVVPLQVLTGVFTAGFGLLIFNSLLETTPAERRSGYVAVFNGLMMSTGAAPMLGVAIYDRLGLTAAFVVAAALRLAGWAWLRARLTEVRPAARAVAKGTTAPRAGPSDADEGPG